MPARLLGTWFLRVSAVLRPTSLGVDGVWYCLPAITILHLRRQAERSTW